MKTGASTDSWHIYILRCRDGTLYTGIAKDLDKRIEEHNGDNRLGAKYTRGRRPVLLVYEESAENQSAAARREAQIKRLEKSEKEQLILGRCE